MVDFIGYLAALLVTVAYLPQVLTVVKTRSTKDLSLPMYLLLIIGVILWLLYGVLIGSWPIIICNAVSALFIGTILFYKIRYK